MKKRILCMILLLCILVPSIVACKKNQQQVDGSDTNGEVSSSGETETGNKYDVYDDLGDIDLGGKTYTIANVDRTLYHDEISVDRYSGDLVKDSIFKRNQMVEARLNITIKNERVANEGKNQYSVSDAFRKNVGAGIHAYDLVSSPVYCTLMFTGENILYDLNKVNNINLAKPYWSQYFNETASIGDSQYMATGAVSLSYYRFLYVTIMNEKVLSSVSGAPSSSDIINTVNDNKWTLEYQKTLAANYYSDIGISGKDEGDSFGFITTDYLGVDPYWSSCEISMLNKNDSNYYVYALDTNRLHGVTETVLQLFKAESTWCVPHDPSHETGNGEFPAIYDMFAKGDSLMATIRLGGVEEYAISNMSDEYMILPIPKYTDDQDTYYSFVHDSFTGMAIPNSTPEWEIENVGAVMEAMASESYRTVTPAYYETALKARYAGSPESVEMLDMITQNVYIDGGALYTKKLLNISQLFRNVVRDDVRNGKGNLIMSTYNAEYATNVKAALTELQKEIDATK